MCKARPVRSCKGPLPFTVPTLVRTVTEADAMQTAAELKAKGVHFIKVDDTLTREAYFAVAAESKRLGLPFTGHLPGDAGTQSSVDNLHKQE